MRIRSAPVLTSATDSRKRRTRSWISAASRIAILTSFGIATAQAQVVVLETFADDLLKDPATTADWDCNDTVNGISCSVTGTNELKLPTTASVAPIQSLINSLLPTDTSTVVDATDLSSTRSISVGDLNGDGFPDLALANNGANSIYFNDGFGGFIAGAAIPNDGGNTRSGALEDLNGDGHLDWVVAEFGSQNASRVHFNNGSGTDQVFTDGDFADLGPATLAGDSIATGDVDSDNDIDIVLGVEGGYVKLFRNDGFGNFAAAEDITDGAVPAPGYHARTVLLGDLDRDGDLDLVAARESDPTRIYFNDGAGNFGSPESAGLGIDNALTAPDSVVLGDVDGDGFLDLLVGNDGSGTVLGTAQPNYLFINSGSAPGVFPALDAAFSDLDLANTNGIGVADVDRDGDLDIVTADWVSANGTNVPGPNRLYLNDGSGGFPANGTTITADSDVTKGLAVGDFDRDGDIDLVYANEASATSTAENRIVFNAGTASGTLADQLFATGLSLTSNLITIPSAGVVLQPLTDETEANRVFRYSLSDDGGTTWLTVEPGRSVAFAAPVGNDLRWRVDLDSPSPGLRPALAQIMISEDAAPVFDSAAVTMAERDIEYTYNIDTSDPDGAADLLDIRATVLPAWLTFTDNDDTTAMLIGTPGIGDVGTTGNDVTLEVVDGAGRMATQSFTIDVAGIGIPEITSPTPGSVLLPGDVTFSWTANNATVDDWQLLVGISVGDNSLFDSGVLPSTTTSVLVSGLPEDGSTLHVTLRWTDGGISSEVNYTYTAATTTSSGPMILTPVDGSVLAGASETFTWTANGEAVGRWRLEIGTSPGSTDLFLSGFPAGTTSTTVSGLPTDGSTVYVRLEWRISGVVSGADYVYTASGGGPGTPAITAPTPGSTLAVGDVNFAWTDNGASVDDWQLLIGTSVGDNSLFDSGVLPSTTTSALVSGLPEDGSTLHVTLRWTEGGISSEVNYTYTAAIPGGSGPMILTPADGSVLAGASETFTWTANGEAVGRWRLEIGTSPGSSDLFLSGFPAGNTSVTVSGLPTDGSTVYVRLEWRISGVVSGADYVYTASGGGPGTPDITSPVPGSTLPSGDVTFAWTDNGAAVTDWQLLIGTSVGDNSLLDTGVLPDTTTSVVVSGLPEDGSTLHVTLRWTEGGTSFEMNYTYTAATPGGSGPMILSPADGSVLAGASETFVWTANGEAVGRWRLEIGTSPGGTDLFLSGFRSDTTSVTVGGLPTDGSTVYVRLEWRISGVVSGADYVYTAAGP